MSTDYIEFISFLEKYRDELSLALSNESEKRQALISNDIERLETMIQLQQAETMKLKGFESKRMAIQAELGFENYMAKDIVAAIKDTEASSQIAALFEDISAIVTRIKEQNKLSLDMASNNLRVLENIIKPSDFDSSNNVYSPESAAGSARTKESSFKKMI